MKPENSSAVLSATNSPKDNYLDDPSALAWHRAGLRELTGFPDQAGLIAPVNITTAVNQSISHLKELSNDPETLPLNGALLLGERGRMIGLSRKGRTSPGGYCKLIDAKDGRFALNLAREDDWSILPAWLEAEVSTWEDIEDIALSKSTDELVGRGIDLGLPIAKDEIPNPMPWLQTTKFEASPVQSDAPLVVDLSGLWAGPLAGSLLGMMGADVVKVESLSRPDGARRGNLEFFNLLNGNKKCVAFEFAHAAGRADLRKLLSAADIVIEASRPRALRQLGIIAEKLLAAKPGKVWLSITGYGRAGANANRIGFGDDIGVAAGLSTIMQKAYGEAVFVGDAIADPVSGIIGAHSAWTKWTEGGGELLNLSMRDTLRLAAGFASSFQDKIAANVAQDLYPLRTPVAAAEELGASTDEIMASIC